MPLKPPPRGSERGSKVVLAWTRLTVQEHGSNPSPAAFLVCRETSLLPPSSSLASVVKVHDGDTLTVVSHGASQRVRLAGIDCPESEQPHGAEATDAQRLPIRLIPPYYWVISISQDRVTFHQVPFSWSRKDMR